MKSKMHPFKLEKIQLKLNLLLCFLLFLGAKTFAQSPELTVKGEEAQKVRMSQLIVNVKVVGNIAYTTAEMHFFNSGNRQMEAELIFPLPENVSVSRYAIDINGKMREAVPVNKNKGKQVFEAIEHRRVDPGLLEKVDGNNFRTRIYPLMPNGERIVIIGYEEELAAFDKNNLAYQLVSRYPVKLDKFELNVSVLGAAASPTIAENSGEEIAFSKWNQSFQTSLKKENYQPSEKLLFKIPIQQNIPSVVMQTIQDQHYFYGSTFIEGNKIAKKMPASIGLVWDNSLSCQNRDLKKELDLLDAYFQKIKNTTVSLYFLNYTFEKDKDYVVSNGNWSALKNVLQSTRYDGGTRFSKINFPNHDEFLFFSDGLSSLSENVLPKTNKPIYTITSSVSADFTFLNYASMKTGGNFINLNQLNPINALDKLTNNTLKFLGIKENLTVTDLYPMKGASVSGNFSFAGISLNPKNEITLLFGYFGEAILERKITLDAAVQYTTDVSIEKLWAQKKIANLDLQYDKNAEEIEILGKKYGIITKNTSLIVLEELRDYMAYDIVPPAELRAEFDRIKKQEQDTNLAKQKNNWENIDDYFTELDSWWKQNIKYTRTKPLPKPKNKPGGGSNTVSQTTFRRNSSITNGYVSGIVLDEQNQPLPGASVRSDMESVAADFDGKFRVKASENSTIVVSYVGLDTDSFNIGRNNEVTVRLQESSRALNEVVVTSALSMRSEGGSVSYAREPVSEAAYSKGEANDVPPPPAPQVDQVKFVSPVVARANEITEEANANKEKREQAETISDTLNFRAGDINFDKNQKESKTWNPDRLYLKALAAAPKEKQYELYFELRKVQERNPSFYFDVAHFFYNQGDVKKALQVISNIADLGLENHQLYKTLTYTLRQWKAYDDALFTAKQIAKWRAHEPQSLRDYALALEDAGKYQEAFDQLIKALEVNYYGEMSGQYEGVEDIILMDINRLMLEHKGLNSEKLDKKYLKKMPIDIRVVMNWNLMDVDLDLHIIEPTGEECYYGHTVTEAGAKFSKDFTQGYGPEQYLIRNAVKGKYQIKTNYFGERELTESGPATVMIEIYTTKEGKTTRVLKTIQLGKVKENELLAEIVW
ncbi:VIT domain-containing protein [Flavobacterium sp. Fl-318]|uniref:VIT domain-containing protein n=1 Tax=Flavobacterium cupriresistens TaxID=2893885 RepID=A0ABU4RFI7_9FLAO|nr:MULTISPECIES: VIT domain-containing protein [unclassified Flavobacterium]MDX6191361.1 VIT domain-containing protein [Flavobacterium sp. Fl-318]UFH43127.1 carboxypeptidase-like regulatory domain-containing protein [Flavobacterium sp. F-323]